MEEQYDTARKGAFPALSKMRDEGMIRAWGIGVNTIEKRGRLRAVAARYGVDLRTAALQFSAAADVAVALVVGARSAQQIEEDWNSLQAKIPNSFWDDLKSEGLIEPGAFLPAL
ncbi:hypothetical protein [Bradyrhizobium arachidis]|uniref:hypothetical protein n=1 Tax=Bradyrhizobium arachidis TaxID=858423 RepID=UPI0008F370BF|nr:hypothetical protein [Bradyrhizobium arachidis]SFV19831.1 Aldo/keto reductase family protein [Bradyrhizobium arachidis]